MVALGELLYGVRRASRFEENRVLVERLVQGATVLECDRLTAEVYSRLKDALRQKGRPIPDNDLWIAATVLYHGLQLDARDEHFNEIEGLDHDRW